MKVFVLIKPNDGIAKAGKIIRTYERDGWRVLKITYRTLYRDFAEIHYINLKNEEYYKELIENICFRTSYRFGIRTDLHKFC